MVQLKNSQRMGDLWPKNFFNFELQSCNNTSDYMIKARIFFRNERQNLVMYYLVAPHNIKNALTGDRGGGQNVGWFMLSIVRLL